MKTKSAVRTAMGQVLLSAIATGSALPKIEIYDGSIPDSMGMSITDALLAELELSATAGTVTDGVLTFSAISQDDNANVSGNAAWARILDRDGEEILYLTVSETDEGGELQMSSINFQAGSPVSISSASISIGR